MILLAKTKAPDFGLYATPYEKMQLEDLKGKRIVIAFYPADWGPVWSDQMTIYN